MTCAATIDVPAAVSRNWDAVVVGAGPGGALAARELARAGRHVLLVEQAGFPRWKVCGACVNARGQSILTAVGLDGACDDLGAIPTDQLRLYAGGAGATLPLSGGVAVSRSALDAYLVDAAIRAGVEFLPSTTAQVGACDGERRLVRLRQTGTTAECAARVVLVASGLKSQTLAHAPEFHVQTAPHSRIGAGVVLPHTTPGYPAGIIHMAVAAGGYVGLVRVETGELNVAAAFDVACVRRWGGVGKAAEAVLAAARMRVISGCAAHNWRGTPLLTSRTSPRASNRIFLLGDAAGYVEPFSGEGISWALAAGAAVAPFALRAISAWTPDLASRWERQFRDLVERRQRVCRVLAALLRHPWLSQMAVRVLARLPGLAGPLLHTAQAPLPLARKHP